MPRGINNNSPVAQSRYRQFRLTVTQEASGDLSYSIYGKPFNAAWSEHQCLVRAKVETWPRALTSTEDVIGMLLDVLRDQLLPGID